LAVDDAGSAPTWVTEVVEATRPTVPASPLAMASADAIRTLLRRRKDFICHVSLFVARAGEETCAPGILDKTHWFCRLSAD
jgi:hypothetical protein